MDKNTPLFFKKLPITEETPPNAIYLRFLDDLPKARAHEILYHGERWVVGEEDILTVHQGLAKTAEKFNAEIAEAKKKWNTPKQLAQAMGISETTLRKRMKLVQNHLTKPI